MANIPETKMSMVQSTISLSEIMGGMSSFMMNYFKAKFPPGLFKETFIAESLSSSKLIRNAVPIQNRPYIGMEVQYEPGDTFFGDLPYHYQPQYFVVKKQMDKYYRCIFEDSKRNIKIYTIPNRVKFNYNYVMKFQTQMKSWDIVHYIEQNFESGGHNYINGIRLPAVVPNEFFYRIADKLNLNYKDDRDKEKLRSYLLDHSLGSINQVISMSSGNPTFMYEYTTNLELSYPINAASDINLEGMIVRDTSVAYSIDAELWTPSAYLLVIDDNIMERVEVPDSGENTIKFNLVFKEDKMPLEIEGKKHILHGSFIPDLNVKEDTLDTTPIITEQLKNAMKTLFSINANMEKIFDVRLFVNNSMIRKEDYTFDFNTFILKTSQPKANVTYTMVLYADRRKLNIVNDLLMNGKIRDIKKMDIF
jgi:hypothetical protein